MDNLDSHQKGVLKALLQSNYSIRTLTGISKDANVSKPEAQIAIGKLMENGLVGQLVREKGLRFYLTPEGRILATKLV